VIARPTTHYKLKSAAPDRQLQLRASPQSPQALPGSRRLGRQTQAW